MACRKHEAITVEPGRVPRIVAKMARP
jgi:hypothetical protein